MLQLGDFVHKKLSEAAETVVLNLKEIHGKFTVEIMELVFMFISMVC